MLKTQTDPAWLGVQPGQLRHLISINSLSAAQDAYNQPSYTPSPVRQCYGGINLVSMKEVFGSNQLTSQSTDIWTIRWTDVKLAPGMQIVFGARLFRIQAIANVADRNILLHLLCLELNAAS